MSQTDVGRLSQFKIRKIGGVLVLVTLLFFTQNSFAGKKRAFVNTVTAATAAALTLGTDSADGAYNTGIRSVIYPDGSAEVYSHGTQEFGTCEVWLPSDVKIDQNDDVKTRTLTCSGPTRMNTICRRLELSLNNNTHDVNLAKCREIVWTSLREGTRECQSREGSRYCNKYEGQIVNETLNMNCVQESMKCNDCFPFMSKVRILKGDLKGNSVILFPKHQEDAVEIKDIIDLKEGDFVLSHMDENDNEVYVPILQITHFDESAMPCWITLKTKQGQITASPGHFIPVVESDGDNAVNTMFRNVQVGSFILQGARPTEVTHVDHLEEGSYAGVINVRTSTHKIMIESSEGNAPIQACTFSDFNCPRVQDAIQSVRGMFGSTKRPTNKIENLFVDYANKVGSVLFPANGKRIKMGEESSD